MRISIDQVRCQGDCICEIICPEVFVLDAAGIAHVAEDGVAVQPGGPDAFARVPAELEPQVRDAVEQCPTQCIAMQLG